MSVPLAQPAADLLGHSDLVMLTERVDDVALLIGQMVKRGVPEVLDRHIPHHGTQRGLSWGGTAVVGLASSVTEGDHRQVAVDTSLQGMPHTLRHWTAQIVDPLDCSDDRLRHVLQHWRQPADWHRIAGDLQARSVEVYALPQDVIRCDATPVSGEHEVPDGGLVPCGHRKEDPTRPQINVMRGSLDPLGRPLSTAVLAGERAADGVYLPIIERIRTGLKPPGLLFVGDGTMSAVATRASLAQPQDWYLSPLPLTGATAAAMDAWLTAGVTKREAGEGAQRWRTNARGPAVLAAEGSEGARTGCAPDGDVAWRERGLGVRSPLPAHPQAAGLATRLGPAAPPLTALTPPRGRGKRHSTDAAPLVEALDRVLTAHRVEELRRVVGEQQVEQTTPYVGRGRGSQRREQRVIQHPRSHLTHIARQAATSAARRQRCGWKALVTKAGHTRLSLQDAGLCDRNAYRVERLVNRLKSRLHIAPLFVKRHDPIEGLTSLLTLGIRGLTVTAFVLRRSLETTPASLPGLHPENKHKMTDKPTAERILNAFADIALTIRKHAAGEDILRRLTPWSGLQEDILQRLGLGTTLYGQLEMQGIGT